MRCHMPLTTLAADLCPTPREPKPVTILAIHVPCCVPPGPELFACHPGASRLKRGLQCLQPAIATP